MNKFRKFESTQKHHWKSPNYGFKYRGVSNQLIFYKCSDTLRLCETISGSGSKSAQEDHGNPNDPRVRLKRDCVGIMAAFKVKPPAQHVIIVGNTHLYWYVSYNSLIYFSAILIGYILAVCELESSNFSLAGYVIDQILKIFYCRDPEWADVKLAQAKYLLSRLARFKTRVSNSFECNPSVVLAGDFNSTPGDTVCTKCHIKVVLTI